MSPATGPRADALAERLLVVDPESGVISPRRLSDLAGTLRAGDLLVLNDAFTWPASLDARTDSGARIELRLAAALDGATTFRAIALGAGDHHMATEERGEPPSLAVGARLRLERGGEELRVVEADPDEPRWLAVRFVLPTEAVAATILRAGKPVQYAHVTAPLALWDVQTPFAARPMAFEMPSAGRPLVPELLARLRRHGVAIATLSHAAGLSSTGRAALDARFPLPERYVIPTETADAVAAARARGGRIVAAGTTVVRALESAARCAARGALLASGEGIATLRLGAATELRVVDGILSGIHERGTSHFDLLRAFTRESVLVATLEAAEAEGCLLHEFGDSVLLLPEGPRAVTTRAVSGTVAPWTRPAEPMTSAPPS